MAITPRFLERCCGVSATPFERWLRVASLPAVITAVALVYISLLSRSGRGEPAIAIAAAVVLIGHQLATLFARLHSTRTLKTSEWRLCRGCLQSLVGLGERGACPECGRPFETVEVVSDWRRQYGERS